MLDEASLAALAPGLASVVRRGVGVATRAGAGAFIARTARRLGGGCAPAVAPLLGPLVAAALAEPSAEVRRGLASAAAALARHGAGPQRTQRALAVLLDAARGEDGRVLAAGQVLLRFASEAQEKVAGVMADVAPLAYLLKVGIWDGWSVLEGWKGGNSARARAAGMPRPPLLCLWSHE